jgi:tight adherence protein C
MAVVLVFAAIGALLGMILMTYRLQVMTRTRKTNIQKQLPDILDLLSVSVEAGLSFDAALLRVAERARGPFVDELRTAYREITLGRPRSEALRAMEARTGLDAAKPHKCACSSANG